MRHGRPTGVQSTLDPWLPPLRRQTERVLPCVASVFRDYQRVITSTWRLVSVSGPGYNYNCLVFNNKRTTGRPQLSLAVPTGPALTLGAIGAGDGSNRLPTRGGGRGGEREGRSRACPHLAWTASRRPVEVHVDVAQVRVLPHRVHRVVQRAPTMGVLPPVEVVEDVDPEGGRHAFTLLSDVGRGRCSRIVVRTGLKGPESG